MRLRTVSVGVTPRHDALAGVMMEIFWELARIDGLPSGDEWLGSQERAEQAHMDESRRLQWRLGRHAAKRLLSDLVGVQAIDRIQILTGDDGAPQPMVQGHPLELCLSIAHRDSIAACVLVRGSRVGCNLAAVDPSAEPRLGIPLTIEERRTVERTLPRFRGRHVALICSTEISAHEALGIKPRGERRITHVEVHDPDGAGTLWSGLEARVTPQDRTLSGWWRQLGSSVLTVVCNDASLRFARHDEKR